MRLFLFLAVIVVFAYLMTALGVRVRLLSAYVDRVLMSIYDTTV